MRLRPFSLPVSYALTVAATLPLPLAVPLLLAAAGTTQAAPADAEDFNRLPRAGSIGGDCPASIDWVYPAVSPINQEILNDARSHLGQQVGDGECATLVVDAMSLARARPFYQQGPTGADGDYVWGQYVGLATAGSRTLHNTVPGDILQLRNATIQVTHGRSYNISTYSHHTSSVVAAVSRDHSKVCVLEQNWNNIRRVRYSYYDLSGLQSGWIKAFRPLAQ